MYINPLLLEQALGGRDEKPVPALETDVCGNRLRIAHHARQRERLRRGQDVLSNHVLRRARVQVEDDDLLAGRSGNVVPAGIADASAFFVRLAVAGIMDQNDDCYADAEIRTQG